MTRGRLIVVVALLLAAAGAGLWWWRGRDGALPLGGVPADAIALSWKGKFKGSATLPATVNWCPGSRVAIVEGLSNDTGFVMVVHAADTLAKGTMSVLPAEFIAAAGGPRPAASSALRWPADTAILAGYRGQNGLVELVPQGGRLSATFTIRMQPPMSSDTISVTGAFRNLKVESRAVGCP
ncbi:MAG: hypothetical protein IPP98_11365 [Gemmatimonadetes bacterium]|nr:hypothetical protein [Gemmatimonadota bacterium]MBL0179709.1 hypothetical protein [Gemmatimonadota bacterium]